MARVVGYRISRRISSSPTVAYPETTHTRKYLPHPPPLPFPGTITVTKPRKRLSIPDPLIPGLSPTHPRPCPSYTTGLLTMVPTAQLRLPLPVLIPVPHSTNYALSAGDKLTHILPRTSTALAKCAGPLVSGWLVDIAKYTLDNLVER